MAACACVSRDCHAGLSRHELPDFSNAEWAAASDAFCGDNAISYEYEQKSFNLQKENPVEVLNVHCTVQDQAGNEKKADYEVTVTYTGLDAAALIEKTETLAC